MAAAFKSYIGGVWRTATKVSLCDSGGLFSREAQRIQVYHTDATTGLVGWREVYRKAGITPPPAPPPPAPPPPPPPPLALSVSIDPSPINSVGTNQYNQTTGNVTVTAAGGVAPYTYGWSVEAWDNPTPPTIGSPGANVTNFSQTGVPLGDASTASFKVVVQDSKGNVGTAFVDASWTNRLPPSTARTGGGIEPPGGMTYIP